MFLLAQGTLIFFLNTKAQETYQLCVMWTHGQETIQQHSLCMSKVLWSILSHQTQVIKKKKEKH